MNACKGRSSVNQLIQQDAKRPDIKRVIVILILNHLWSHVFKSSTKGVSLLHVIRLNAPAEITDFNDVSFFDQDIFRLDISVNETLLVHVVDTTAHLNEEVKGSVFGQELLLTNQVKQVAFAGVLKRQIDGGFVFETGIKSANVFVI
jgi:hypothetical protein